MNSTPIRNYAYIFAALISGGTVGYHLIEGWTFFDSAYMTIITLSTVGYGELRPLSPTGKMFTSALILFGVGTLAFTISRMTELLLERRLFYRRRLRMDINRLDGHVIVCGYGRMGKSVCDQLRHKGQSFVVIERDTQICESAYEEDRILHLLGDATDDTILERAGIEHASALATVLPGDAENLFVTLSSRKLNPKLTIVSRTSDTKNEAKMIAAGADRVLNPFNSGGRMMVRQLLQPTVTAVFDVLSDESSGDLSIDELKLGNDSPLIGTPLAQAPIRRDHDVIVIAIRREGDGLIFNPPGDLSPQSGDVLILLGRSEDLLDVEKVANPR
jgi:voltage-gated potassium channel